MISVPPDATVLYVDDDSALLNSVRAAMISVGLPEPAVASDSREVMKLVDRHRFQLVILDLNMPYIDGMALLQKIKSRYPTIECVIVTAIDDVPTAVEALRYGAYDYIVKPVNIERLAIVINNALERFNLLQERELHITPPQFNDLKYPDAFAQIIAADEKMALVFHQVECVAPTDYTVMISGESGTGKELLARTIHKLSPRAEQPFVAVNMASISRTIFEDQFFGHAKGAYTDARDEREGFVERSRGGTLFLDEITELDHALQAKLLRVLEEKEFYRLGSTEVRRVDVRFITATNRNIQNEIANGRFREDLFYRLNRYAIRIPPLRDRRADIGPIAQHYTRKYAQKNKKAIQGIDPELTRWLTGYDYPGNVRELQNLIATAVLSEAGSHLSMGAVKHLPDVKTVAPATAPDLVPLAELEKQHIARVLEATGGNRAEAAKILGVNITTVYRKIEKYRLSNPG